MMQLYATAATDNCGKTDGWTITVRTCERRNRKTGG